MNIVKICKKHGGITIENTYLQKTKSGNPIRLCSICKRGYRNDWAKLNPDKVKLSQERKRSRNLKKLENGTLSKTCKLHGVLPIQRIRIDSRGSLVCRNCTNDCSKRMRDKDPIAYRNRFLLWLNKNPDKRRKYLDNESEYRRERKLRDPEFAQHMSNLKNLSIHRNILKLSDSYIKNLINKINVKDKKKYVNLYPSKELIELFRKNILLKRFLRKWKKSNDKPNKQKAEKS